MFIAGVGRVVDSESDSIQADATDAIRCLLTHQCQSPDLSAAAAGIATHDGDGSGCGRPGSESEYTAAEDVDPVDKGRHGTVAQAGDNDDDGVRRVQPRTTALTPAEVLLATLYGRCDFTSGAIASAWDCSTGGGDGRGGTGATAESSELTPTPCAACACREACAALQARLVSEGDGAMAAADAVLRWLASYP